MILDISAVLKKLQIEDTGRYENHFYVIPLVNSDEYAKMYTKLSTSAIDTEYPNFATNTNDTVTKVTNYFELDLDNETYTLFLIANFDEDKYYLKIGEKV